jgi:hypothetical protein
MRLYFVNHLLLLTLIFCLVLLAGPARPVAAAEGPRVEIVNRHPENETMAYAASELRKYIDKMGGRADAAVIVRKGEKVSDAVELGLFSDFGFPLAWLKDPSLDDAIRVDVSGAKGRIAGSNARSVLFGVYRFLEANGCRWLRPGADGEIIPLKEAASLGATISDKAFYRFRGNNHCGTYPLEQILEKIEWAPKVGLNMLFNEFSLPRRKYNGWYEHPLNELKLPEARSDEEIMALHDKTVREIKRRGLIYHAYGHGWTSAAIGLTDAQSVDPNYKITGEAQKFLALVNGERKTQRSPMDTQLCYGNPEVRQRMVRTIADWAEAHPEVDLLHIWLADGMNLHCECECCRDTRPSDFYVMMLNGVDRELTQRGVKTRLVFLIYVDLLWPPEKERFTNPDRFVMMFAPIGRSYADPYDVSEDATITPYVRNKTSNPSSGKENVAFLRAWQKVFPGEAFVFDYHFVWYHYMDPGYLQAANLIAEDIPRLTQIGMSGFVSCQNLRSYFPTGYPLFLHAKLLWNPQANAEQLAKDYFQAAFGQDGLLALDYLKNVSGLVDAAAFYHWKKDRPDAPVIAAKLAKAPRVLDDFRPVVERNMKLPDPSQALSWRYLFLHMPMADLLSHAMRAKAQGDQALANLYGAQLTEYLEVNEDRTRPVFDLFYFRQTMRRLYQPVPDAFKVKGR